MQDVLHFKYNCETFKNSWLLHVKVKARRVKPRQTLESSEKKIEVTKELFTRKADFKKNLIAYQSWNRCCEDPLKNDKTWRAVNT